MGIKSFQEIEPISSSDSKNILVSNIDMQPVIMDVWDKGVIPELANSRSPHSVIAGYISSQFNNAPWYGIAKYNIDGTLSNIEDISSDRIKKIMVLETRASFGNGSWDNICALSSYIENGGKSPIVKSQLLNIVLDNVDKIVLGDLDFNIIKSGEKISLLGFFKYFKNIASLDQDIVVARNVYFNKFSYKTGRFNNVIKIPTSAISEMYALDPSSPVQWTSHKN